MQRLLHLRSRSKEDPLRRVDSSSSWQQPLRIAAPLAITRRPLLLLALVASTLAGCAGVPQQQLVAYTSSFGEAKTAALGVYDRTFEIVGAAAPTGASYPLSLGSAQLNVGECDARYAGNAQFVARCNTLATVTAYNDAMLALAQGAPAQAALVRLDSAFVAVSGLATAVGVTTGLGVLAGPAAAALKGVIGEALKISDRAELKAKLDQGAPIVQQILDALRLDASRVYAIGRQRAVTRLTTIENEALNRMSPVLNRIRSHATPSAPDTTILFRAAEARLNSLLGRAEPKITPSNIAALMSTTGVPLDNADIAAITQGIPRIESAYAEFDAAAAEWVPLRTAITAYAQMLDAVRTALRELIRASNDPLAAGGGTAQLVESVGTVREKAEQIRQLLRN